MKHLALILALVLVPLAAAQTSAPADPDVAAAKAAGDRIVARMLTAEAELAQAREQHVADQATIAALRAQISADQAARAQAQAERDAAIKAVADAKAALQAVAAQL